MKMCRIRHWGINRDGFMTYLTSTAQTKKAISKVTHEAENSRMDILQTCIGTDIIKKKCISKLKQETCFREFFNFTIMLAFHNMICVSTLKFLSNHKKQE